MSTLLLRSSSARTFCETNMVLYNIRAVLSARMAVSCILRSSTTYYNNPKNSLPVFSKLIDLLKNKKQNRKRGLTIPELTVHNYFPNKSSVFEKTANSYYTYWHAVLYLKAMWNCRTTVEHFYLLIFSSRTIAVVSKNQWMKKRMKIELQFFCEWNRFADLVRCTLFRPRDSMRHSEWQ